MLLYIIRHGQPHYGPQERLTDIGHKQARALAHRMVQSRITRIYASPMRRARETAMPTADALGLPIHIEPWTSEDVAWKSFSMRFPDGHQGWCWSRDDASALQRGDTHDLGDKWWQHPMLLHDVPQAKEGYASLVTSSDEFLARHGYVREGNEYRIVRPNDERIAVFCHHGFSVTWLTHLLRVPPNVLWPALDISHTGVSIVQLANRQCGYTAPCLMALSDLSHLYADEGADYLYHSMMNI